MAFALTQLRCCDLSALPLVAASPPQALARLCGPNGAGTGTGDGAGTSTGGAGAAGPSTGAGAGPGSGSLGLQIGGMSHQQAAQLAQLPSLQGGHATLDSLGISIGQGFGGGSGGGPGQRIGSGDGGMQLQVSRAQVCTSGLPKG